MKHFEGARRCAFWLCTLLAVASLAGCGTPPTYKARPTTGQSPGTFSLAHSKAVEEERHAVRHLDAGKSIVYTQNFGGGGVALGLLLGPLGVAANAGMIDSATEADAARLRGKLSLAPRELFLDAATRQGLEFADDAATTATNATAANSGPGRTQATPYLFVSKTDNERLLTAVAVRLEQGQGTDQWSGVYMYQLPSSYKLDDLARPTPEMQARLGAEAAQGFSALTAFIAKEGPAKDGQTPARPEKDFTYKSDLLTPRFEIEMQARFIARSDDLIWFRTFGGVYAVRTSNIKVMSGKI
ncbi:hypothetical protein [Variovorax boronicumulans]|uniref:hypothetical protein n=1 Tax=Variovorax boronicumulans TaxID=436515 RepID=UPI00277E93DD|nr:hypothetical protein [Variovorax boronicumulans]MDQ0040157.1 hypothetical protein [Variovorax boronicumulans]